MEWRNTYINGNTIYYDVVGCLFTKENTKLQYHFPSKT